MEWTLWETIHCTENNESYIYNNYLKKKQVKISSDILFAAFGFIVSLISVVTLINNWQYSSIINNNIISIMLITKSNE